MKTILKLSLCLVVLLFVATPILTGQDAKPVSDKTKASNIIDQFFDIPQAITAYDISKIFNDKNIKDTLTYFEKQLGVKIVFLTYLNTDLDEFWPNQFRGMAKKSRENIEGNFLYIDLLFSQEIKGEFNVEVQVSSDFDKIKKQDLENLKVTIEDNLKKHNTSTLEAEPYGKDIAEGMNLFFLRSNSGQICDTSHLKEPLKLAIASLLDTVQNSIKRYNLCWGSLINEESGSNSWSYEVSEEDGFSAINYKNSQRELNINDLENLMNDPYYADLFLKYSQEKLIYVWDTTLKNDLEFFNDENNYCDFIVQIESQREQNTKELIELAENSNNNIISIIIWLKDYLYADLIRRNLSVQ